MKFLITGVSGFVGEELVYFLQNRPDYHILGLDKEKDIYSNKITIVKKNIRIVIIVCRSSK